MINKILVWSVILLFSTPMWANTVAWQGTYSRSWSDVDNWKDNQTGVVHFPGETDTADIRKPTVQQPEYRSPMNYVVNACQMGNTGGTCTLDIYDGTLTIKNQWWINNLANQPVEVTMSGGIVNVGGQCKVGNNGPGKLTVSGGNIVVKPIPGTGNPTTSTLFVPGSSGGSGMLCLYGGQIDANMFSMQSSGSGRIEVSQGKLVVDGNVVTTIRNYINNGWIYPAQRYSLSVQYSSTTKKTTLWAVSTAVTAWNPSPADHSVVKLESGLRPTLTWSPGDYAVQHKVYFGTDPNNLTLASTQSALSWTPGYDLVMNKTYYWRVDEIGTSQTWPGTTWSFTIPDYYLIEDFESYTSYTGSNPVSNTWLDYYNNWTGSTAEVSTEHHGGLQSMVVAVNDDTYYYSLVERSFSPPQDLSKNGFVKYLEIWFKGYPTSDLEPMWLEFKDQNFNIARVNYPNLEHIRAGVWQPWRIPLSALTGIDITKIDELTIGFGVTDSQTPAGKANVFFDDFRLYGQNCLVPQAGDANNDCTVNMMDLSVLANNWLAAQRFTR